VGGREAGREGGREGGRERQRETEGDGEKIGRVGMGVGGWRRGGYGGGGLLR